MIRFNKNGMRVYPFPQTGDLDEDFDLLVIEKCFCPNGHSLISDRVDFNGFKGIVLKIIKNDIEGFIAFSPIWGDKSRFVLDINIEDGETLTFLCPTCNVQLPISLNCNCGGSYIILYTDEFANFTETVSFCNRVGCCEAFISKEGIRLRYISSQIKWG